MGGGGDDLLAQIQMLLMQYLQQGPDTPVAAEAGNLLAAIEQTGAGGGMAPEGDMGGMMPPPDMGGGEMPPPDMGGDLPPVEGPPLEEEEEDNSGGDSFKKARKGAKAFLKSKAG